MRMFLSRARPQFMLLLILALVGLGGFFAVLLRHSWFLIRSLHPQHQHLSSQDYELAKVKLPGFRDIEFLTSDGLSIKGWYVPSLNRAAVVFIHGGLGNRMQFINEASELSKHGFGVLLYDSRASGESAGTMMTWGAQEQKDLSAAISFLLLQPELSANCLGAQGFSIGASTLAMVAARDQRISAIVLNAMWSSLHDEISYKAKRFGRFEDLVVESLFNLDGLRVNSVRPLDSIGDISPRPIFMISGDHDDDTPVALFVNSFAAAKNPKQLMIVNGAPHGHYSEYGGKPYLDSIVRFFSDNLCHQNAK